MRRVSAAVHALRVDSSQETALLWLPSQESSFHEVFVPQESKGAGSLHGTKSPGVSRNHASHTCPNAETETCVHLCSAVMIVFILVVKSKHAKENVFKTVDWKNAFKENFAKTHAHKQMSFDRPWCVTVSCSDLSYQLDMRHPRVVLHFLRFVDSYNEVAPVHEKINLPLLQHKSVVKILTHEWLFSYSEENRKDVADLRSLIKKYTCFCAECEKEY